MPRKRDIEAAIAAYNATDPDMLLPADAARLLTVMFRRSSVCQRKLAELMAEGFDRGPLARLLRVLLQARFIAKDPQVGPRGSNTYRLHLPSVRP